MSLRGIRTAKTCTITAVVSSTASIVSSETGIKVLQKFLEPSVASLVLTMTPVPKVTAKGASIAVPRSVPAAIFSFLISNTRLPNVRVAIPICSAFPTSSCYYLVTVFL